MVRLVAEAEFPSRYGEFTLYAFENVPDGDAYVVLTKGDLAPGSQPLLRIHSQCLTGDVLGSLRCDCGEQLQEALRQIHDDGCGMLIYHPQEGRGIGILNKLAAYSLQDKGADTVEANHMLGFAADHREYRACLEILGRFNVCQVRLMSNNPGKIKALSDGGVEVVSRVPLEIAPTATSGKYLRAKKEKMGHLMEGV